MAINQVLVLIKTCSYFTWFCYDFAIEWLGICKWFGGSRLMQSTLATEIRRPENKCFSKKSLNLNTRRKKIIIIIDVVETYDTKECPIFHKKITPKQKKNWKINEYAYDSTKKKWFRICAHPFGWEVMDELHIKPIADVRKYHWITFQQKWRKSP